MSCARSAKGSVKLRSPMVLCTYGSGRARGEREERAGAQSLLCVVSSISLRPANRFYRRIKTSTWVVNAVRYEDILPPPMVFDVLTQTRQDC